MKLIKSLALVLFLALWLADYSNAQDVVSTPNLIGNQPGFQDAQWRDIGGYSQIGGQQPTSIWGCCTSYSGSRPFLDTSTGSPNGQSGALHWSYGYSAVSQIIGINYALSQAGTGIQINGYNWGYEVRNMNGGGGQGSIDPFSATTFLRDGAGYTVLSDTRHYNSPTEWNWHGGTVTASSPLSWNQMSGGHLGIQFVGYDAGYWGGYYGPQVRNVSLSLNYSAGPVVDPCAENPTSSPSCPGYAQAMLQSIAAIVAEPVSEPVVAVAEVVTAEPVVEQVVQSVPQQTQQQAQQSTQEPTQTAQVAAQPSTQTSSPEEKKESKGGGPSLSAVLSILKNEQDRISGVESKVVEAANEQAQAEADKTVEQAIAIAESSSSESAAASDTIQQAIAASSSSSQQQNDSSSQASGSQLSSIIQQQNSSAASSLAENNTNNITAEALGTGIDPNVILQNTGIQIENRLAPIVDVELPKLDAFKVGATTPADDFLEPKTFSVDQNQSQTNDSVKKPSQTNDLAVGVSFESLATTPDGFNQYNVVMKDVAFYEPKEIYKGQKNVDNVKALRQLASDKLHQEMVEQQYRR